MARKINCRSPKKVVIIVCQGAETERIYFSNFQKKETHVTVRIQKESGKDPISIIKAAKYLKDSLYEGTTIEKIYCVYDVDDTTEKILKKSEKCAIKNDLIPCVSNPCFEIWYLLHFLYSTADFYSFDVVRDELLKHIPEYSKNKKVFEILRPKQKYAINNAKLLMMHHNNAEAELPIRGRNPSTQVYEIVEYLIA